MQNKTTSFFLLLATFIAQFVYASDSLVTNPDPLRYKNEIETFKLWDQKNSVPENAILFTGSSSIRMWKTHLAFPQYPVINRGFGGAHISDVIYYYNQVILKYNPALIVFYCGDNDIAGDKPVKQVFDDYLTLIIKIETDLSGVSFVFISVKPSGSRWDYWEKMNMLNEQIKKYNQQQDNLYYIDLASPLLDSNGKPDNTLFLDDRLHLNDKGYKIWNSSLHNLLKFLIDKK
jgi:lysophospholipase L1-like esterase